MRRFDAVLCDVDGVLRRWDPDGMSGLDRAFGLPPGTLAAAAFAPERLRPAILGEVTDAQWRRAVAADLSGPCGSAERARDLVSAWSDQTGQVDQDVRDLLAAVRRRAPVVLVSNATTRLEQDLNALGVLDVVDGIVNSARVGRVKPDPELYLLAARHVDADPGRCLFVDDTPDNVVSARAVGMTGHLHRHVRDLRHVLASMVEPTS